MLQELTSFPATPGDLNRDKTAVTSKGFAESWTLDPTGNWCTFREDTDGDGDWDLDQARDHNAANEIVDIDNTTTHVAHDRCGNMTRIPKPDDWGSHYDLTYDAWNRLVSVTDGATQDLIAEYEYDGRNYRVTKTLPSESPNSSSSSSGTTTDTETRHFYYNHAWQCLEERLATDSDPSSSAGTPDDPPSTPDRQFIWGPRYIDDLILRDRATSDPRDNEVDERLYALQDPNWNVVALGDSAGAVPERYTYLPYGVLLVATPCYVLRDATSYKWEVCFGGYRWDAETRLYQVRNRVYSPRIATFLQRDQFSHHDGYNLYEYVGDNPLKRTDPDGKAWPAVVAVGGVILTACCFETLHLIGLLTTRHVANVQAGWPEGYSTTGEGTPADALQHCIGACLANQSPGFCLFSWVTRLAVNSFEDIQGAKFDIQSDLNNNAIGFAITGSCTSGCLAALAQGSLSCADPATGVIFVCPPPPQE